MLVGRRFRGQGAEALALAQPRDSTSRRDPLALRLEAGEQK
jgi:hypothetical protein